MNSTARRRSQGFSSTSASPSPGSQGNTSRRQERPTGVER
eukprot:jgi/Mesvir1/15472/Mv25874-RA.1